MDSNISNKQAAWEYAQKQLNGEIPTADPCSLSHYGRVEIRQLLDFIYGEETRLSKGNNNG